MGKKAIGRKKKTFEKPTRLLPGARASLPAGVASTPTLPKSRIYQSAGKDARAPGGKFALFRSSFLKVYSGLVQQDVGQKNKAALPRLHFSISQFSVVARSGNAAAIILLLAALLSLVSCKPWTIRPLESKTQSPSGSSSQQFDADAFVDSIWQSKVVPTMLEKAVDLSAVLTALNADVETAKKQYSSGDAGGTTHFLVKGTGRIRGVESRSQNRTITLALPNYQGKTEVAIQVGPVFRGTALRDAVGFIQFNQFVNQLQFAEVGNKLNERVAALVVKDFDLATAQGKQVSFYGAFTLTERSKIVITPTRLTAGGQP